MRGSVSCRQHRSPCRRTQLRAVSCAVSARARIRVNMNIYLLQANRKSETGHTGEKSMGWLVFWMARSMPQRGRARKPSCSLDRSGAKSGRSRCRAHCRRERAISHRPHASRGDNEHSRQDSQGVGVTQSALPALNGNDGLVGPDDTHIESVLQSIPDSVVDVDLPLSGGDTSRLGVVDGVDTSVQVTLSSGEFVSGD